MNDFLPQTPYFLITESFSSDNKSNLSLYFFLNFRWLLILSFEIPYTQALFLEIKLFSLLKSFDSIVHPGVSSLG